MTRFLAPWFVLLAGCSAFSDFGSYEFGGDGGANPDGSTDGGGSDAGRDGSTDGGGDGGSDGGTTCDQPSDCGDATMFLCLDNVCVPRVFSGGPTAFQVTSGGGVASSPRYRVRVQIGAPQPMGRTSSAAYRITTGPGAMGPREGGRN